MPSFYRGARIGTHWHINDARLLGFTARKLGIPAGLSTIAWHIARGTTSSPFISLTRSYAIARDYAVNASRIKPSQAAPAFVYEIVIEQSDQFIDIYDPIVAMAESLPSPLARDTYHHDGDSMFILGVADPLGMGRFLAQPALFPPRDGGAAARTPNLSMELETLVRALRDAEILAFQHVPARFVRSRFDVW